MEQGGERGREGSGGARLCGLGWTLSSARDDVGVFVHMQFSGQDSAGPCQP